LVQKYITLMDARERRRRAALDGVQHQSGETNMGRELSPLEAQAVDALRRAKRLPFGATRSDLQQLAKELLWLNRHGMDALVERRNAPHTADDSLTPREQLSRGARAR
jgi:hypothetical protein